MKRYEIVSGEFSLVINESNCEKAAHEAIRLHLESNHHSLLGEITMVESKSEDAKFFSTRSIIDDISYSLTATTSCIPTR